MPVQAATYTDGCWIQPAWCSPNSTDSTIRKGSRGKDCFLHQYNMVVSWCSWLRTITMEIVIMKTLRDFFRIIDHHTLIVTLLSLVATCLCLHFRLIADMPTTLIGVAVIFPIVFSINGAYRRREQALLHFASLKSHAVALYYAHRDWLPKNEIEHRNRASVVVSDLLKAVRKYLIAAEKDRGDRFGYVYEVFSRISNSHETLRKAGVTAGEISRANQYLRAIIIEFERMSNILQYRTPTTLRAYSRVFLNAFPVLFGPYFANLANKSFPVIGYGVAVLYSLVLVSLDNIQDNLENPYDEIGEDDVKLDVSDRYMSVLIGSSSDG